MDGKKFTPKSVHSRPRPSHQNNGKQPDDNDGFVVLPITKHPKESDWRIITTCMYESRPVDTFTWADLQPGKCFYFRVRLWTHQGRRHHHFHHYHSVTFTLCRCTFTTTLLCHFHYHYHHYHPPLSLPLPLLSLPPCHYHYHYYHYHPLSLNYHPPFIYFAYRPSNQPSPYPILS